MMYWHMQLHPNDKNFNREREVLEQKQESALGEWLEGASQMHQFKSEMKILSFNLNFSCHEICLLARLPSSLKISGKPRRHILCHEKPKLNDNKRYCSCQA